MVTKILRITFIILAVTITSCKVSDSESPIGPCKICYGTGYTICSVCKGTGVCNYCTNGNIDCMYCSGWGRYWDYKNESYVNCSYCTGTGLQQCRACGGWYSCGYCGGTGGSKNKCPNCDGTGINPN